MNHDMHQSHHDTPQSHDQHAHPPAHEHTSHASQSTQHDAHKHDTHAGHGVMHEGHATLMRDRFWICLVLTIPVLIYSPMLQIWFGFTAPQFPGSQLIAPVLGTIIFLIGGLLFLDMARQELALRQPGMMTLISLAVTTSFLYSVGIFFFPPVDEMGMAAGATMDFFWELATLITIMLFGHCTTQRRAGTGHPARISETAA